MIYEWAAYLKTTTSPRTQEAYLRVLKVAEKEIGPAEQWTVDSLLGYIGNFTCEARSRNTYLQILRSFCRRHRPDLLERLPGKISFEMNRPVVAVSDEIDQLLVACNRKKQRLGLLLVADAGLREAEVRSLTWGKVDLEEGSLTVHGKGNKQRCVAIVTERLRAALEEQKVEAGYVVPGRGGQQMARGVLSKQFCRLSDRVVKRHLPAHSFRHGFAIRASSGHVPVRAIQLAMGHQSLATTSRYLEGLDGNMKAQHQAFAEFV